MVSLQMPYYRFNSGSSPEFIFQFLFLLYFVIVLSLKGFGVFISMSFIFVFPLYPLSAMAIFMLFLQSCLSRLSVCFLSELTLYRLLLTLFCSKIFFSAEILIINIFRPLFYHAFVRNISQMF